MLRVDNYNFHIGKGGMTLVLVKLNEKIVFSILYDCGTSSADERINSNGKISKLKNLLNDSHIDVVVISHLDWDHCSLLEKIVNDLDVKEILIPYLDDDILKQFSFVYQKHKISKVLNVLDKNKGITKKAISLRDNDEKLFNSDGTVSWNVSDHNGWDKYNVNNDEGNLRIFKKYIKNSGNANYIDPIGFDIVAFESGNEVECVSIRFYQPNYDEKRAICIKNELNSLLSRIYNLKSKQPTKRSCNKPFKKIRQRLHDAYARINRNINETCLIAAIAKSSYPPSYSTSKGIKKRVFGIGSILVLTGDITINDDLYWLFHPLCKCEEVKCYMQIPHHGSFKSWKTSSICKSIEYFIFVDGFKFRTFPNKELLKKFKKAGVVPSEIKAETSGYQLISF